MIIWDMLHLHKRSLWKLWMSLFASIKRHVNSYICNSVSSKKPQYVIVKQIGSQSKLTLIRQNKCSFYKRRSVFRISFSNFKQIELFYYLSFHCSWCCPISAKTGEFSLLLYDLWPSFNYELHFPDMGVTVSVPICKLWTPFASFLISTADKNN